MTAKTDTSESAKPKYRRASARKVRTGCKTWIAAAKPRASAKKRNQEKSPIEVFELDDTPPPTISYTPLQPPALFQVQPSIPRRNQTVVVLEKDRDLEFPLSLDSRVLESPELELAPIQKQLPLRNEKKLPRIAELVRDTAISSRFDQWPIPRVDQASSLPKLADYLIESAGSSRLISLDRSCHGAGYDNSVLLPRLRQPFGSLL
ncbi:DRPLA protein [Fusarium pseudocircinatum]|uniref:DRPLA protein n=1 Tax=Fusarium pseudocircinatum TaxID=56676 RepID=A0A8H5UMJ8_9HYPO|nr:DRPLA protein [Fusarium pseudocircinatum]